MKVHDCNRMMLEAYPEHDDRIVLAIGSPEQHGYLSVGTDAILAERVAIEAAEPLGIPVGGSYQRPEADVLAVWEAGVAEVRDLLENGWYAGE
jgi:creatinine amidohydrolase/Fe(II)-dependent formamide hydrolase-like protein